MRERNPAAFMEVVDLLAVKLPTSISSDLNGHRLACFSMV